MKLTIIGAIAAGTVAITTWMCVSRPCPHSEKWPYAEHHTASSNLVEENESLHSGLLNEGASSYPVVTTSEFTQAASWDGISNMVRLINNERSPTGDWESVEYQFDTSFTVSSVAARQADELFVCGVARNGDDVIEQWIIQTSIGAHYFHRQIVGTPIGQPSPGLPSTSTGIMGGRVYRPVVDRQQTPLQTRVEIYRGSAFGGVRASAADPEGRFILVLSTAPCALVRLPVIENSLPETLYGVQDTPELQYGTDLYCMEHYELGRVYILHVVVPNSEVSMVLFIDSDNDGNFELKQALTDAQWHAAEYSDTVWKTDFVTHYQ